ncbi:MAG: glycosyltransferase family 4 protein [Flavobacteriaceae bacterium]|nr:glycosyltransferase family 4 protein [Flavobacteriaceae bacterium]
MGDIAKPKLIRTATVATSLDVLLKGQFFYFNSKFDVIAVSGNQSVLTKIAKREGITTRSVPMERSISILKDLNSLWALFLIFKKEKPLIVHSITPKAGLLSMIAAFFAHVPIRIHTFTGLIFPTRTGFMFFLLKNMDRLTCLFATKIIPEGQGVKRDLLRHKVTKKQLKVVANGNVNGISSKEFSGANFSEDYLIKLKKELKILETDIVFCFVGRIVGDKGINELIVAFMKLSSQYDHVKLLLVGDYERKLDPITSLNEREINENSQILSVGWQVDVRPYLAISDVFVFPSYREGFPNVVMQAGAMGLPCIVSDISGCNEIIKEGVNGMIIPPKNEKLLFMAMKYVLENEEHVSNMASVSRKIIVENYEQQYVWEELLKEYNRLINSV